MRYSCTLLNCSFYDKETGMCLDDVPYISKYTGEDMCRYNPEAVRITDHIKASKDRVFMDVENKTLEECLNKLALRLWDLRRDYNIPEIEIHKCLQILDIAEKKSKHSIDEVLSNYLKKYE